MGTWGPSLYSDDFASDLRATITAVARLPFDGERIASVVRERHAELLADPSDEYHEVFWLVLADQLAKHGIDAPEVREKALKLLAPPPSAELLATAGWTKAEQRKRESSRVALRARLLQPSAPKARKTLAAPDPFVMEPGQLLAYPTAQGKPINPHVTPRSNWKPDWTQDGWGAALVVARGHAFEYLAWYRIAIHATTLAERPDRSTLLETETTWILRPPGRCSRQHFERYRFELWGNVPVARHAAQLVSNRETSPEAVAVYDIGLGDALTVPGGSLTRYARFRLKPA